MCRGFLNGIPLLYEGYLYGKTPYQLERKDTYMGLKIGRNKHQEDSSDDKENNNGFEAVASSFGFMAQLRGSYTLKILFFFCKTTLWNNFGTA